MSEPIELTRIEDGKKFVIHGRNYIAELLAGGKWVLSTEYKPTREEQEQAEVKAVAAAEKGKNEKGKKK
jgi:hypothetical protein